VVENYSHTPAVADGLAVMVQAYQLLGMNELASDSLAVLSSNYPEHPSINKDGSFNSEFSVGGAKRSFINKATLGLFDRAEPPKFDNRVEYLRR
jgi:outer membrane protein assembly factor BamD